MKKSEFHINKAQFSLIERALLRAIDHSLALAEAHWDRFNNKPMQGYQTFYRMERHLAKRFKFLLNKMDQHKKG